MQSFIKENNTLEEKFQYLSDNHPLTRRRMNFLYWHDRIEYIRYVSVTFKTVVTFYGECCNEYQNA